MECYEARQLLNPFLEGELDAPLAAQQMEAHLASCPACLSEMEGLRRSLAQLEGLPLLDPPAGLSSQVMAAVLRMEASKPAGSRGLAWVLASLLALVGAFLMFGYLSEQGLPWDTATVEALLSQSSGLDVLPSLLVGMEVGVVVGMTLLFVALASLLVQLMGREQRCQHGQAR